MHNLPTGVGMYRLAHIVLIECSKSPHRRGDVPQSEFAPILGVSISPQAWGCTGSQAKFMRFSDNLPTGVGMYRTAPTPRTLFRESPHRRGDVPENPSFNPCPAPISPQAWGCTEPRQLLAHYFVNLPTGVGMYRKTHPSILALRQSPHRRGDVPSIMRCLAVIVTISPQAWGCTEIMFFDGKSLLNLPTGVGMYRSESGTTCASSTISPQAWGCTVIQQNWQSAHVNLPTGVGMYRH